jgi:hypothetical protein
VTLRPVTKEEFDEAARKVSIQFARYDELYHAVRMALGTPDVLHPDLSKTRFGAQIQSGVGDESEFIFSINFEDESALEAAAQSGRLDQIADIAFTQLIKRFRMKSGAWVKVRFNSFEYMDKTQDGFHRFREGDWRTDYEVVLNSLGQKQDNAQNP